MIKGGDMKKTALLTTLFLSMMSNAYALEINSDYDYIVDEENRLIGNPDNFMDSNRYNLGLPQNAPFYSDNEVIELAQIDINSLDSMWDEGPINRLWEKFRDNILREKGIYADSLSKFDKVRLKKEYKNDFITLIQNAQKLGPKLKNLGDFTLKNIVVLVNENDYDVEKEILKIHVGVGTINNRLRGNDEINVLNDNYETIQDYRFNVKLPFDIAEKLLPARPQWGSSAKARPVSLNLTLKRVNPNKIYKVESADITFLEYNPYAHFKLTRECNSSNPTEKCTSELIKQILLQRTDIYQTNVDQILLCQFRGNKTCMDYPF